MEKNFLQLGGFLGSNKWEAKLLQSNSTATAQKWPSWGRTCRNLTAPYPYHVGVPTPLAGPNKMTFTGYFPSRTPRAQPSFRTDLLGLFPEQSMFLESIKRPRVGFFPIRANEIVWFFSPFPFIRHVSWHKFPHCCSWPASVLNNSGLVIFASQTHIKKYTELCRIHFTLPGKGWKHGTKLRWEV